MNKNLRKRENSRGRRRINGGSHLSYINQRQDGQSEEQIPSKRVTQEGKSDFHANQNGRNNVSTRRIGIKKLEELLSKNPEDIILSFKDPRFQFTDYLNAPTMGDDLIQKLTLVINKAFDCNSIQTMMRDQIDIIVESVYFKSHLYEALSKPKFYASELIEITINMCCRFLYLQPYCRTKLGPIKDRIELHLLTKKISSLTVQDLFNQLKKADDDAINRVRAVSNQGFSNLSDFNGIEPPNDFTQLNVVPKLDDILSNQITHYLRKNISNGAYQNVTHYLDVQFRLLREDFLQPLRDGVRKLREIICAARLKNRLMTRNNDQDQLTKEVTRSISRIESLSAYFNCSIIDSVPSDLGMVYKVRLHPDKTKAINWDISKKLLFGSLVCMSNDFFEKTILIGSICERDPKKLKEGIIMVKFNVDIENQAYQDITFGGGFIMLETSAYFDAYKHVLQALVSFQHDGEDNFPFRENLVYCQNQSMPMPRYLTNVAIDLRPLVDKSKKFVFNHKLNENILEFSLTSAYSECYISNHSSWPNAAQMGLDPSQYEAVKLAFQNKLALIQGPPGTGKTFIGVKLVELLLHNKRAWWNRIEERHRPILMICYTNHALDQFLEYCIHECGLTQNVVRVGGQSRSENLENFKLAKIKQQMRSAKQVDSNIHHRFREESIKLKNLKAKLEKTSELFIMVTNGLGLLHFNVLSNFMDEDQKAQFSNHRMGPNYSLLKWLGFFDKILDYKPRIQNEDEENEDEDDETASIVDSISNLTIENSNNNEDQKAIELADSDEFVDVNEDANNERMLEDDITWSDQMEKEFEKLNKKQLSNEITKFEEIEHIRSILNGKSGKWQTVRSKRDKKQNQFESQSYFLEMINRIPSHDSAQASNVYLEPNLNRLDHEERFLVYMSWASKYKKAKEEEINQLSIQYNQSAQMMQELRLQEDRSILQDAYIVAMTTTGSSRYHSVLKDIGPRIIIVEEAAEVFESHIVASLSKHCEHLILIGDHIQLRPNPAVYKLAKDFDFDVSLFERLINNNTKKVMLRCQHRMRPEISLLMKQFYDQPIEDHSSVLRRDSVAGLKKNIFFINHSNLEDQTSDEANTTKINKFEARYLAKLAQYLIKQKQFRSENITILSMYLGQMGEIKKLLKTMGIGGVKCTTVDNYQGEENEIILLSLVRSNKDNRIGFLNVKNRVCVALSRARSGLYVIGNFDFICKNEKNDEWKQIVTTLKNLDSFGKELVLTCGNHPKNDLAVTEPEQFEKRPNGGCELACEFRLSRCGHSCTLRCHTFDREHKEYTCTKRCDKQIEKCKHSCKQQCSHDGICKICSIIVDKTIEECGHSVKIRCDREPKRQDCISPCMKFLSCGHKCTGTCGVVNCGPCEELIEMPRLCAHGGTVKIKCSASDIEIWKAITSCAQKCNKNLQCGHKCSMQCSKCFGGYVHGECGEKCDRFLFCGHKCKSPCPNECQPCMHVCENRCNHSKCQKKCSDICTPCQEPCTYKCEHLKCTKKCGEICNRQPCENPCPRKIKKCGHPCIGFCGEPCPTLCRLCHKKKLSKIVFGNEDDPEARFVYLEDCGHCIESSAMDYWMESRFGAKNVPNTDENNNKNNSIELPQCPLCKTPIRRNLRYSKYVKIQLNLIEKIKLKNYGDLRTNKASLEQLKSKIILEPSEKSDIMDAHFRNLFLKTLRQEFNQYDEISFNDVTFFSNMWNIFQNYQKLISNIQKNESVIKGPQKMRILFEIEKLKNLIIVKSNISNQTIFCILRNSSRRLEEISNELQRIQEVLDFYRIENESKKLQVPIEQRLQIANLLAHAEKDLINKINQYKDDVKIRVENLFFQLSKLVKVELSKEEKAMIVAAMGLGKGHWYNCPNGHVYAIGECGGPMQKAKCPECKADIGGLQHRLESGNAHASHMDGSLQPAWPI